MKRDQNLNIRLTAEEKTRIEIAAREQRRTAADFARLAILSKLESEDIPVETPADTPADTLPSQYITGVIADVIDDLTEENYEPAITFWKSEAGDLISEPCSAMCHILIHTQAGRIRTSVREDLYRQLAPIAPDNELVRLLSGVMWPCEWLPAGAFQEDLTVVEIAGDYLFTPDLNQAKAVLSALADQTLPTQKSE